MVAVLVLLLALELVCLGLLALLRFRAAGSVLLDEQLQQLLVVLGAALKAERPGETLLLTTAIGTGLTEPPGQERFTQAPFHTLCPPCPTQRATTQRSRITWPATRCDCSGQRLERAERLAISRAEPFLDIHIWTSIGPPR